MNGWLALSIWICGGMIMAAVVGAYSDRTEDNFAFGILASVLWPLVLAFLLCAAPFVLAYFLGVFVAARFAEWSAKR